MFCWKRDLKISITEIFANLNTYFLWIKPKNPIFSSPGNYQNLKFYKLKTLKRNIYTNLSVWKVHVVNLQTSIHHVFYGEYLKTSYFPTGKHQNLKFSKMKTSKHDIYKNLPMCKCHVFHTQTFENSKFHAVIIKSKIWFLEQ